MKSLSDKQKVIERKQKQQAKKDFFEELIAKDLINKAFDLRLNSSTTIQDEFDNNLFWSLSKKGERYSSYIYVCIELRENINQIISCHVHNKEMYNIHYNLTIPKDHKNNKYIFNQYVFIVKNFDYSYKKEDLEYLQLK
jgi:hypothetical protein